MKKHTSALIITLLIALSAAIYLVQFTLFRDWRDTAFYMLQDWAFLPVQVALVTIIAGRIVSGREKAARVEKTQMLASSFFSDLGAELLALLRPCADGAAALAPRLQVRADWTARDFARAETTVRAAQMRVAATPESLLAMRRLLAEKRMSMLVIASNPVLLEHEDFTDMLWAVFHLTDELTMRTDLPHLSPADRAHLNTDAQRVLTELLVNWLCYMAYLKTEYPYLFRLEMHRNPFTQAETSAAVPAAPES